MKNTGIAWLDLNFYLDRAYEAFSIPIKKDGYCFLRALQKIVNLDHNLGVTLSSLESYVFSNFEKNFENYAEFFSRTSHTELINQAKRYLQTSVYCSDAVDLMISGAVNSLGANVNIFQSYCGEIQVLQYKKKEAKKTFNLKLHEDHYEAILTKRGYSSADVYSLLAACEDEAEEKPRCLPSYSEVTKRRLKLSRKKTSSGTSSQLFVPAYVSQVKQPEILPNTTFQEEKEEGGWMKIRPRKKTNRLSRKKPHTEAVQKKSPPHTSQPLKKPQEQEEMKERQPGTEFNKNERRTSNSQDKRHSGHKKFSHDFNNNKVSESEDSLQDKSSESLPSINQLSTSAQNKKQKFSQEQDLSEDFCIPETQITSEEKV